MRCPKCHYLSFEPEPRCRNCGYDLSFEPGDLAIAPADTSQDLLADFDLLGRDAGAQPGRPIAETIDSGIKPAGGSVRQASVDRQFESGVSVSARAATVEQVKAPPASNPTPATTAELPLFVQGLTEPAARAGQDEPLVKLPPAPRPPLAVRRPTPAPGRVRERYQREAVSARQAGLLERDLLDPRVREEAPAAPRLETPSPAVPPGPRNQEQPAGAVRRIEAAFVDLLFIGAINLAVVWLTLQRCDLTFAQAMQLPMLPLAAYLFLVDGGYLLMFTATNGQTVGKMAAGLRVIGTSAMRRSPTV